MRKGRQGCRGIKNRYSRFSRNRDRVQLQPAIKTVPSDDGWIVIVTPFLRGGYLYIYIYIRRVVSRTERLVCQPRKWGRMDATTGEHKRERPITGRKYKSRRWDRDMKIRWESFANMVHGCVMHVLENVYRGKLKPLVRSTIFRIRVKRVESKYRLSEVKNWSSEFHILSNLESLLFFEY